MCIIYCCKGRMKFMQSMLAWPTLRWYSMIPVLSISSSIPIRWGSLESSTSPIPSLLTATFWSCIHKHKLSWMWSLIFKTVPCKSIEYLLISLVNKYCLSLNIYIHVGHLSLMVITSANCYVSVSMYTLLYMKECHYKNRDPFLDINSFSVFW